MRNDDVELIQRTLAGDENAFESLVRKYQQQVHTHALRKTGDFQIAEDIVQETFLQVYQRLETLNNPTQFSAWLHAIVKALVYRMVPKKSVKDQVACKRSISRK